MPDTDFSPGLDAAAAFRRREADKDKRVAELEAALRDLVETWRNGDVVGGHEAIGRAEELLK